MVFNKIMVFSGITTLIQAAVQMILSSLGIAQYFCIIDFLRGFPLLLYIKILYFNNPNSCGLRVNIGDAIDEIANQAFVLVTQEPITVFRTFIINCTSLGLSVLWIITSVIIIMGGAKDNQSKCTRWPWIIITVAACGLDLIASVTYTNDSFQTRTLNDMMDFIGGTASGVGSVELDTTWTAWIMVLLYSRFVFLFLLNILFVVIVIVDCNVKKEPKENGNIEASTPVQAAAVPQVPVPVQVSTAVQASPVQIPTPPPPITTADRDSSRDEELASLPSERITTRIPRAGLSRSFRQMKAFLFKKSPSPEVHTRSNPDSLRGSPDRSPRAQHVDADLDKKRTVNFPESLLSLPQRLENIIAQQQRRLDQAVIDTSGRTSPPRASQSMPQLATTSNQTDGRGHNESSVSLRDFFAGAGPRPSSRGSFPGRIYQRPRTACGTSSLRTKTYRQSPSRTMPFNQLEKHPSTELRPA